MRISDWSSDVCSSDLEMFHLRAEPVSAEPKRTADADEALERFRMTGHGAGSEHARQRVPHQGLAIAVHLVVAFDPWLEHILDEAKEFLGASRGRPGPLLVDRHGQVPGTPRQDVRPDRKSTRLNSSH